MSYETRQKKKSDFTADNDVTSSSIFDFVKNGINKKTTWGNMLALFEQRFGLSMSVYEAESAMIADTGLELGNYAIVEENYYAVYKVTNIAAGSGDVTLSNGLTASQEGKCSNNNFNSYSDVRGLKSSAFKDGDVITVTDDGIAGDFVVKTGTVTDNGGTLIVFTDDSNRYAERVYSGAIDVKWFGAVGDGVTDDTAAIQSAIDVIWRARGGELRLGDESDTFRTTSRLYFRVVDNGPDRGISIVSEGATIDMDHTDSYGLEIHGAFKVRLQNFYLFTSNPSGPATGLLCAGANNTVITDNNGDTGSGKRSEHFDLLMVRSRGADVGARFGSANDQLDYTVSRSCYFRGTVTGCIIEEGNTYATFIECAAHGSTTANDSWLIRGQVKLVNCYAFSSEWAVTITGDIPVTIQGMEGEILDNGIRWQQGSTASFQDKANLTIQDTQLFLTSINNIGLSLGGFVSVTVENSYFGGVLDVLSDNNFLQGCYYQETNTYFESRQSLYNASIDYDIRGSKQPVNQVSFFESTMQYNQIQQNLISDSASPNSANSATVTLNNVRYKGARNAAHKLDFTAATSSYLQFRGGTEVLTTGWETEIQGQEVTFGLWAKLDESEVSDENTDIRLWIFTGVYPGTTIARKNMKLTKEWKYYFLTSELPDPITTALTFAVRNTVTSTLSINFRAPMITFKGVHNNYYETSGTAKIY